MKITGTFPICVIAILLAGCASSIPPEIKSPIPDSPEVAEVRKSPERFEGSQIRWGGTVVGVENREKETWLEVVARELGSSGRPQVSDYSPGRFMAVVQGFLDPSVYEDGREVTVNGVIQQSVRSMIDEFEYEYPVVRSEHLFLWEPVLNYDPYFHHPYYWYDPWYYPYPYHYRHPYRY